MRFIVGAGAQPASAIRREALRRLDPGLGLVLLLGLLALWPFLSRPGLPGQTDAELHIFRLAELSRLVGGGVAYPRWAPDFYYGYGYPLFNYYAPLGYYLGLLPMAAGASAVAGVKAVFVLGLLLAALGMYGFVRLTWGQAAGVVAAAVYVYAPYIQFVDPQARGDLAESLSLGLFPVALWALERLRRQPGALSWWLAVGLVAGIVLAHNLMALVFVAIFLAWAAWTLWADPARRAHSAGRNLFAALFAGMGLAAFFWLPVALESRAVNLGTLVGQGGHFDFRNHFLSLSTLLAAPRRLDWGATAPDFVFNLGLAQWLLGGAGALALLRRATPQRRYGLFFLLAGAGLIFMMLPASTPLWQVVPALPFLQFPWRLLGAAAAMLAVLAGVATASAQAWLANRLKPRACGWLLGGLACLVILPALPLSQVPPWPADFGDTGPSRVAQIELEGRWLGTTSTADFVPATVDTLPSPSPQVVGALLRGQPVDRVNRATLPAGASVTGQTLGPLRTLYQVSSPQPFVLRLFQFAFPGWQAALDGRATETEVALPEGFLVVPLPAGQHQVEVRFGSTPARRLGGALSLATLVVVVLAAARFSRSQSHPEEAGGEQARFSPSLWPAAGLLLGLWLLFAAVLEPAGWLHRQSSGLQALPAQNQSAWRFAGEVALIGFDAPAQPWRPGQTVPITLYWHATAPLQRNLQVFVHLLGPDGLPVAQSDKLNPGDFPTSRWPLDRYVRDEHRLLLPAGLPAGSYRLTAGLWIMAEGQRLPVEDGRGVPAGDVAPLLAVQVGQER